MEGQKHFSNFMKPVGYERQEPPSFFVETAPFTPQEIADLRRLLRDNKPVGQPITPDDLKMMHPSAIKSLDYWIHANHNVVDGSSLVSWSTIEVTVRCKSGGSKRPFDPAYFEYIKRTYESQGHFTVTHEFNEEKGKHYVRFQVKDK